MEDPTTVSLAKAIGANNDGAPGKDTKEIAPSPKEMDEAKPVMETSPTTKAPRPPATSKASLRKFSTVSSEGTSGVAQGLTMSTSRTATGENKPTNLTENVTGDTDGKKTDATEPGISGFTPKNTATPADSSTGADDGDSIAKKTMTKTSHSGEPTISTAKVTAGANSSESTAELETTASKDGGQPTNATNATNKPATMSATSSSKSTSESGIRNEAPSQQPSSAESTSSGLNVHNEPSKDALSRQSVMEKDNNTPQIAEPDEKAKVAQPGMAPTTTQPSKTSSSSTSSKPSDSESKDSKPSESKESFTIIPKSVDESIAKNGTATTPTRTAPENNQVSDETEPSSATAADSNSDVNLEKAKVVPADTSSAKESGTKTTQSAASAEQSCSKAKVDAADKNATKLAASSETVGEGGNENTTNVATTTEAGVAGTRLPTSATSPMIDLTAEDEDEDLFCSATATESQEQQPSVNNSQKPVGILKKPAISQRENATNAKIKGWFKRTSAKSINTLGNKAATTDALETSISTRPRQERRLSAPPGTTSSLSWENKPKEESTNHAVHIDASTNDEETTPTESRTRRSVSKVVQNKESPSTRSLRSSSKASPSSESASKSTKAASRTPETKEFASAVTTSDDDISCSENPMLNARKSRNKKAALSPRSRKRKSSKSNIYDNPLKEKKLQDKNSSETKSVLETATSPPTSNSPRIACFPGGVRKRVAAKSFLLDQVQVPPKTPKSRPKSSKGQKRSSQSAGKGSSKKAKVGSAKSKSTPTHVNHTPLDPNEPNLSYEGPPVRPFGRGQDWPLNWTERRYRRQGGATRGREDSYWFPPLPNTNPAEPNLKHKLRSLVEVYRYLDALSETGDADLAYERRSVGKVKR